MAVTQNLKNIIDKYIAEFKQKYHLPKTVKPSLPIVWFGNKEEYDKSPLKIVTVGLNPSLKEFEKPRFEPVDLNDDNAAEELALTLNDYFKKNPYKTWFNDFEKVIKRFDASYYEATNKPNRALHIDIYSAIATNPTWGKLNEDEKKQFNQTALFVELLGELNPDMIICSVNQEVFRDVFSDFCFVKQAEKISNKVSPKSGKKCGFYIRKYKDEKHNRILISGRNMKGQPFGGMSEPELAEAIKEITD